jgi:hypothetical protein
VACPFNKCGMLNPFTGVFWPRPHGDLGLCKDRDAQGELRRARPERVRAHTHLRSHSHAYRRAHARTLVRAYVRWRASVCDRYGYGAVITVVQLLTGENWNEVRTRNVCVRCGARVRCLRVRVCARMGAPYRWAAAAYSQRSEHARPAAAANILPHLHTHTDTHTRARARQSCSTNARTHAH